MLLESVIGELCMKRMRIGNQLYGSKCTILGLVNGWDNRQSLIFGLAAVIPATKVLAHMESSPMILKNIIPILVYFLSDKMLILVIRIQSVYVI